MNIDGLKEWEPFSDYPEPTYVLYEGVPAIYIQDFEPEPIKIRMDNDEKPKMENRHFFERLGREEGISPTQEDWVQDERA